MSSELKVIFTTHSVLEAKMVCGVLDSNGIQASIFDENMAVLNPLLSQALGGVRIVVRQEDFPAAEKALKKLLRTSEKAPFSGSSSPFSEGLTKQRDVPEQVVSTETRVSPDRNSWGALIVIFVFLGGIAIISSKASSWFYEHTIGYFSIYWTHRNPPPLPRLDLSNVSPETRAGVAQPINPLLKKAQAGDSEAEYYLGWKYYFGVDVPQNDSTAIVWIQKAAESGFVKAEISMGSFYAEGRGVAKDGQRALQWLSEAADQGDARAQFYLGNMYRGVKGIPQDDSLAFSWIQKSADQGFADAQDVLGFAYENGRGVGKDYQKAVEWIRKAANQGNARAESHLAYCYMQGLGVAQDYDQAHLLAEKAAWHGNRSAQYNLGTLYETGHGVQKSRAEMYAWFLVAASHGDVAAEKAVADWKLRLSVSEMADGHEMADRYNDRIFAITHGTILSD